MTNWVIIFKYGEISKYLRLPLSKFWMFKKCLCYSEVPCSLVFMTWEHSDTLLYIISLLYFDNLVQINIELFPKQTCIAKLKEALQVIYDSLLLKLIHHRAFKSLEKAPVNMRRILWVLTVSRQIWRGCHTSVDSGDLNQVPPKQSAVCSTCIIPALPVNCQFIWMACAFGMSATQPILGWL